jgi:hypothetical protein
MSVGTAVPQKRDTKFNFNNIHKSVKHLENSQQINYPTGHDNSYANREKLFFQESPRTELPLFAARNQQYQRCCGSGRP